MNNWTSGLVDTSVSNGMGQRSFSGQRDRSYIIVTGQRDKLRILLRAGTGRESQIPGQPKSGTECGTKPDRAEKDVLKQEKVVQKKKRTF